MLARLRQLAEARKSFAFETTLASRSFAPWLREQRAAGYALYLLFLYLPSPEFAVRRVAERVKLGGHDVPEKVIRRRYDAELKNLFDLYLSLMDAWWVYDNAQIGQPKRVAFEQGSVEQVSIRVDQPSVWQGLKERYGS